MIVIVHAVFDVSWPLTIALCILNVYTCRVLYSQEMQIICGLVNFLHIDHIFVEYKRLFSK